MLCIFLIRLVINGVPSQNFLSGYVNPKHPKKVVAISLYTSNIVKRGSKVSSVTALSYTKAISANGVTGRK